MVQRSTWLLFASVLAVALALGVSGVNFSGVFGYLVVDERHVLVGGRGLDRLQMHLVLYFLDKLGLDLVDDLYLLAVAEVIDVVQLEVPHLILHHVFQLFFHLLLYVLL